ncbi:MAG: GxGYxYP family putative glycoside hydrolase [Isosphaeraceae bacterium]|nr:GxGYxYP family putative glycoside hydrolase [Isosphaeraceae bacterium]
MSIRFPLVLVAVLSACAPAHGEDARWWPGQAPPRALVRTSDRHPSLPLEMMVQSLAGLAAKAVNEGRGDEMVWVSSDNVDVEGWYERRLKAASPPEVRGAFGAWELVDRYAKQGIVKGYVLYCPDTSKGRINDHRQGMDLSVNVATSLAGLLDAIIVDESLEADAQRHGLAKLEDARGKGQAWCFATYKGRFNRRILCTQDPKKSNVRDLAVAQKALVLYGALEPVPAAMKWLEPLSPIVGWNGGDEFEATRLSSIHGHIQTATDWCLNLPVLMAGSGHAEIRRAPDFDPRTIDWADRRSTLSFVLSDGDNVQWLETSFFHANKSFWDSPDRGKIPFGWSCCFDHLVQLCPEAIDLALTTRTPNDRFIEWGGGYYYPDLFGLARPDRRGLLARQARRTLALMGKTNTRIIGFNVAHVDSPDALRAYDDFAKETDGLLAMLVFQYDPYEGGAGKTFWVKDARGVDVPVISARYSLWEHTNRRPGSGTPAKVAREVRANAVSQRTCHDWAIVHAWSYFRRAPGADEEAENMEQEGAPARGGVRGYTPAVWCTERLPASVRVVAPEELAWRVRMAHDPEATRRLIGSIRVEGSAP